MSERIPLSAIEHAEYCERQAALIHVERYFASNADTVRGDIAHLNVDTPGGRRRRDVRVEYRLPVWSEVHRIYGFCDVVEFSGSRVTPIEHKSGRLFGTPARVQLCAQALCLEEMFSTEIDVGEVYLAGRRSRHAVQLDADLRASTIVAIERAHSVLRAVALPAARNDLRCRGCSLKPGCVPHLTADRKRVGGLASATWRP